MAKRKTKEDAGSIYGARRQENQLRGAEERSTQPGRMASSSMEPALHGNKVHVPMCIHSITVR